VTRERAFSFLSNDNLKQLIGAYFFPEKYENIARLVDIREIRENNHNLSIPLYVHQRNNEDTQDLSSTIAEWKVGRIELKKQSQKLFDALAEIGVE
jgi:type I restriction enzyme M protein